MLLLALTLRVLAAYWLGPGPFGPDGPGAEAAAVLGGHPYPLHPLLIRFLGGGRAVSVLGGVLGAWGVARMGTRLGAPRASAWVLACCAPLLLIPAAMAGGDAAATGLSAAGVALAWSGWPLLGGCLAGASIGVKPVALPMLPMLLLAGRFEGAPRWAAARALAGAALAALPWLSALDPLLHPRPAAGLLGSWWSSTQGLPPDAAGWTALVGAAGRALAALPAWTGLHALAALAIIGVVRAEDRRMAGLALGLAAFALLAPAALLGEQLRPRYLGAASVPLTALAGLGLRALWPLGLLGLWPAFAVLGQLSQLRAHEEGTTARPAPPWPGALDVREAYRDAGVCGAGELRALAQTLAASLPPNATLRVLRLRDGREGELRWPLLAQRPDVRIELIHAGNCPEGACAGALRGPYVTVADASGCQTEVLDPGEQAIAAALRPPGAAGVYALVE